MLIRKGDSLRLTVADRRGPADRVEMDLDYDGLTFDPDVRGAGNRAVTATFARPGEFAVQARVNGVLAGKLRVVVCAVELPARIPCEVGRSVSRHVPVTPAAHAFNIPSSGAKP